VFEFAVLFALLVVYEPVRQPDVFVLRVVYELVHQLVVFVLLAFEFFRPPLSFLALFSVRYFFVLHC